MPLVERISVGLGVHGMGWASLIWPELALGEVAGTDGRWQILGLMYLLLLWAFWAVRFVYRSGETGPTRSTLAWQTGLCIALLPWLQWIPGPELFGPRFLYLPMLFAIPLLPTPRRGWLATWPVYAGLLLMFALWAKPEVREQSAGFESPEAFWVERTRHRPMDSRAWNGRANSVFASSPDDPERLRQARFFWMRSIELDSNYSRPHVGLAMLARMEGNDVMEENFLRAAIRISSNNPVAFANLGALHLRQGNHRQALTAYESATLLQPGRAAFWRGLARAHAGLGSEQEARVAIERALALDPSDPLTIQVRKSLDP
jgi:tetratricopeptide (TPR) repeat protein